jgi:hypothetical protein
MHWLHTIYVIQQQYSYIRMCMHDEISANITQIGDVEMAK